MAAVIDEGVLPQRKVVVSTKAEILHEPGHDDAWRDVYRRICLRYWDEEAVDAYLESTIHVRRALISVPVRFGHPRSPDVAAAGGRRGSHAASGPRATARSSSEAVRPRGAVEPRRFSPAAARQPSGLSR